MSKNNVRPHIHQREWKSYADGFGVMKQLRRIFRRDTAKGITPSVPATAANEEIAVQYKAVQS